MELSILFPAEEEKLSDKAPDCLGDLRLDRVLEALTQRKEDRFLLPLFYSPVSCPDTAVYRQEIFKELEDSGLRSELEDFSRRLSELGRFMDISRRELASQDPWKNNYLCRGRILDYALRYCSAAEELCGKLAGRSFKARGLEGFSAYLSSCCRSEEFCSLRDRAAELRAAFDNMRYCMLIKNGTVRVKKYEGEESLSDRVLSCFEKFRSCEAGDFRKNFSDEPHAAHVEAGILSCLSRIFPEEFSALDDFCGRFTGFPDKGLLRLSGEMRFYLCWLDYTESIRGAGLPMCCPELSTEPGDFFVRDVYDIALAKLKGADTVTNDLSLSEPERISVITGPNQGGKTSLARALGQLHYLASLGLPVPGSSARLLLTDRVLCHFPREEDSRLESGQLQEELSRLKAILSRAGDRSLIIINEIFASTTLKDAVRLGGLMMDDISRTGALAVIVTFIEELARCSGAVSVKGHADRERPGFRSYKFSRGAPDGLAYAMSVAEKYRLSYEQLKRRLGDEG